MKGKDIVMFLLLRFIRDRAVKGPYVSTDTERVIAAKIAELTAEFVATSIVNVSHVSLHVGFVHALIRTESAGELGVTRIHFASHLYVLLQQILRGVDLLAEGTYVPLVHVICG